MIVRRGRKGRISVLLTVILFFLVPGSIFSQSHHSDWSDLDDPSDRVYGSEKEDKYPINAFIFEKELWENHYSFSAFFLYKTVDYPRYSSLRVLPFYYHLQSKIDNRERNVVFPFFYQEIDGNERLNLTPLSIWKDTGTQYFHLYSFLFLRRGDEAHSHTALLPFFYTGSDATSNYYSVFPLFYYESAQGQRGSNFFLSPLFYLSSSWSEFRRDHFSISPFHFLVFESEKDDEDYSLGFPVLPFLAFFGRSGTDRHYNFLSLLDIRRGEEESHYWLIPAFFYRPGEEGYLITPLYANLESKKENWSLRALPILPFLYFNYTDSEESHSNAFVLFDWKRQNDGAIKRFFAIPFLFSWFDGYEQTENTTLVSPFFYYNFRGRPDDYSRTLWFPVLPLFYSKTTPVSSHNFALLFDWKTSSGSLNRFWFLPFYYYGGGDYLYVAPFYFRDGPADAETGSSWGLFHYHEWDKKNDADTLLTLLYYHDLKKDSTERHVLPFFLYWGEKNGDYFETSLYTLLFHYNRVEDRDSLVERTIWFPFLPLIYNNTDPQSSHTFAMLLDWKTTQGNLERFWILPALFYGVDRYLFIPPLYFRFNAFDAKEGFSIGLFHYHSWSETTDTLWFLPYYHDLSEHSRTRHLLPFFLSWKEDRPEDNYDHSTFITALWYWDREIQRNQDDVDYRWTLWFPIIPIFYRNVSSREGNHTYALLADWTTDPSGSLDRFWFLPLYYYRRDTYHIFFPFYIRPSAADVEEGYSFGFPFYHSWTQDKDFLWAALYYHNFEGESYSQHVVPFYFSWYDKKEETRGRVLLPIYVSYQDRQKDIHINITGLSVTRQAGLVGGNVGYRNGAVYLDTEISWMYDLVSVATRVSIPIPGEKNVEPNLKIFEDPGIIGQNKPPEQPPENRTPAIVHSNTISRENSRNFFSFTFLYGLVSYQRADAKTHFRTLPFLWLTWDKSNDDNVYFVPFLFTSYHYEDTEYFVVHPAFLPLYGRQKQGESYVEAYGAIAYIREYDAETKKREYSILWPLINVYTSPSASGSRFLPFWRSRQETGPNWTESSFLSPVYFRKSESITDEAGVSRGSDLTLAPLFLPLSGRYRSFDGPDEEEFSWVFPFYAYTDAVTSGVEPEEQFTLFALPLLYYNHTSRIQKDEKGQSRRRDEKTLFAMGYYSQSYPEIQSSSFLFGLYATEKTEAGFEETQFLYGLVKFSGDASNNSSWLFPFYYRSRSETSTDRDFILLTPLFYYSDESHSSSSSFTWLSLPLIYYSTSTNRYTNEKGKTEETTESTLYAMGYYRHRDSESSKTSLLFGLYSNETQNAPAFSSISFLYGLASMSSSEADSTSKLIPFYYYNRTSDESSVTETLFTPLFFSETTRDNRPDISGSDSKSGGEESQNPGAFSSLFCLYFPFYYRSEEKNLSHTNVMLLVDMERKNNAFQRLWVIPFFFYKPGDDGYFLLFNIYNAYDSYAKETSFHIFPLYLSWKSEQESTKFILGTYLYSSPQRMRQNFLYLYDHTWNAEGNDHELDLALGMIHYRNSDSRMEVSALYRILMGIDYSSSDSYQMDCLLWLGGVSREKDDFHMRLLPLFWYNSDERDTTFISLPWIHISRNNDSEIYQLGLMGAAWYRHYDRAERTDLQHSLLGILYYSSQVPNERGTRFYGSLWGGLWEYQTEDIDDYSKFSILKFVYSRTTRRGETSYRVFGVSL